MTELCNERNLRCVANDLRQMLMQMNPHRKEIFELITILNNLGASFTFIAACLSLQRWRNFFGSGEWTKEDVRGVVESGSQYYQAQNFSISDVSNVGG